ncbi:MAG TPA: PAS domain S-box protein, partial [Chloroflexota bacterium]|nr:PAS domain S-box protein [Chloroflexota bacterium]
MATHTRPIEDATLLQLLMERMVDYAIFLLTPDGHVASWNAGAERLKGYTADEIVGQHFSRFYTDEDRAAGRPAHLLTIASNAGRVEDVGWRVRKDGSRFWADVVITALRDDEGVLRGFAKVVRDQSETRIAEEQLSRSEQRFSTLVDSIKDYAIFLLSPDGTVLTWNQGAERLKGYAPHEIIGQSFERFYPAELRAAGHPQELLSIAIADGRVEEEGWRVRKDGSLFWADVVITALRNDNDKLIGFAKVTRDLSDRRAAEEQLRLSEERFRTLVDSIKDYAIFRLAPDGTVLTWNLGAQTLNGYFAQEIIGQSFELFYTEEDRRGGRPRALLAIAREQGRVEDKGWRVRKGGERFWADVVITALRNEHGELVGYAKVTRDLTEQLQAENDRAARLAAERTAERIERLQTATAALAAASRAAHAAEILTDVGMRIVGAAGGVVAFPTTDQAALEVIDARGYDARTVRVGQFVPVDGPAPLAYAWRTRAPVFLGSRAQVEVEFPELS